MNSGSAQGTPPQEFIEKYWRPLLAILLLYVFLRSVIAAAGKVYWYDELLTQLVVSQAGWKGMMAAIHAPLDSQPPLFYLIERLAAKLFANQDMALRLPAALGIVVTFACVFAYVQRRGSRTVALLSAMFLMLTAAFKYYAEEARPYSLVVACIAFALVCYQRAAAPRWAVLLAASLILAESLHYLAVLAMVPLGVAEIVETLRLRKVRWRVWLALALGPVPLLFVWKLLLLNKSYYGAHHVFAGFSFSDIPQMYGEYFQSNSQFGTAIALAALAGVAVTLLWRPTESNPEAAEISDLSEAALLLSLIGLPFFAYAFSLATHTGITARYALATVLGIALGFGFVLRRGSPRAIAVFAAFIFGAAGVGELHFWRFARGEARQVADRAMVTEQFLAQAGHGSLPVIVPNGNILWMQHYLSPEVARRFVYLTQDTQVEHDTLDRGLKLAANFSPIRVARTADFTAANPEFLVYMEGAEPGQRWLTSRMLEEGWSVLQLRYDASRELYLVKHENTKAVP